MEKPKYAHPYPATGYHDQGPPPVMAPSVYYYSAPPPKRGGFLQACLATLCCCCLQDTCCDPTLCCFPVFKPPANYLRCLPVSGGFNNQHYVCRTRIWGFILCFIFFLCCIISTKAQKHLYP